MLQAVDQKGKSVTAVAHGYRVWKNVSPPMAIQTDRPDLEILMTS
jgi:hypothetical protein